ncbi:MAG: nucleotidyl transferase AbiEii/AbiGii toxin family protein [Oscillatoriales cyanobacterium C42_A2020_001]|nr:nucleotidyl transferase AbiEii/AbiGii toxin family protein [Leptolyngbyaceae cyanobacterium C42_A2020_001]
MSVVPDSIKVPKDLPFLEAISWQLADCRQLTPLEMLHQYERNWHYLGVLGNLSVEESAFVQQLSHQYGSWLLMNVTVELHQKILVVLRHLNADFLRDCGVYFGGGTLLALTLDEYRVSQDVDFLCSSTGGYRQLRRAVFDRGYDALFANRHDIELPREIQSNQYGIRFPAMVDGHSIKVEMVSEGRIELDDPETLDAIPVACLSRVDCFAEKLLANADRWLDESTASRDLIDLAVLRSHSPIPEQAITKAEAAYPVVEPLKRAITNFQAKPDYRDRCYQMLCVRSPNLVIDGLDQLAADFKLSHTPRTTHETSGGGN